MSVNQEVGVGVGNSETSSQVESRPVSTASAESATAESAVDGKKKPAVVLREGAYEVPCPWCGTTCVIAENQVNCGIFRCGVLKGSLQQIPPHAKKPVCDALKAQDKIWGCAGPFKFTPKQGVSKCGYI